MVGGVGALFDNPILNTKININQKLHRLEYHHGHFLEKQTLQIPGKIQPRNPEVYRQHAGKLLLPTVNLRFLKSCLNYVDGLRKTSYLDVH